MLDVRDGLVRHAPAVASARGWYSLRRRASAARAPRPGAPGAAPTSAASSSATRLRGRSPGCSATSSASARPTLPRARLPLGGPRCCRSIWVGCDARRPQLRGALPLGRRRGVPPGLLRRRDAARHRRHRLLGLPARGRPRLRRRRPAAGHPADPGCSATPSGSWLHRQRAPRPATCRPRSLVGHRSAVAALDEQIDREAYHGYRVIGCCLPADQYDPAADAFNGLPVLGGLDEVADVVAPLRGRHRRRPALPGARRAGAAPARAGTSRRPAPSCCSRPPSPRSSAPRVRIRPVCGLPLLHMERPELTRRPPARPRTLFDRTAALLGHPLPRCRSCSASPWPSRSPAAGRSSSGRSGSAATARRSRC